MKNICIIGDSHTAAMRTGWVRIRREFPEIEVSFFSAHRVRFVDLAVVGDALVPQSEELTRLLSRTAPTPSIGANFDRYVLCGLDYSILFAMTKLMGFRSEDQAADNRAPLSRECYLRAMTGCLRDTVSMQTARKLRAITSRPMTIMPGPRISDSNELKLYPFLRENGSAEKIAAYFRAACDLLGREVDATVAEQPPETLRDPLQTLSVYAKDPPREFAETELPAGWKDYQHMNADYGALVLRALFSAPGF
jgi:hypothetical protein